VSGHTAQYVLKYCLYQYTLPKKKKTPQEKFPQTIPVRLSEITMTEQHVSTRFARYSIPKASFRRLCIEILHDAKPDARLSRDVNGPLQQLTEEFLVKRFQKGHFCMSHRKAQTLKLEDMRLCDRLNL
jgi:histone H3/H4